MDTFNNSYALLIGIDDPKLPSDRDATDIYDVLIDKNYAGYPKENVILLTLGKGTKKGVLNAFKTLEKKINIDSKIFIYYSGHGVIDNRLDVPAYFLQLEGWDSNKPEETGMKGDEVKQRLNGLIAERIIFFFDCCHAQGMTKGSGLKDAGTKKEEYLRALKKSKLKNPEGLLHEIDDEEGMAIISSCKDNQLSLYFKNDRNSLFTAYLLKILKGEHKTYFDDEHIKVLEVAGYLVEEIPKDAARDNLLQNPFVNLQIDKNFELSRVPKSKLSKKRPNDVQYQVQSVPVKKEVKKVFRKSKEANNAIIFVHGFSGDAHLSFGNMPELLMEEKKLEGWDMYPFGFNANVDPEMGKEIWATIKDINRITDNLSSAINYKFKQYDRIAIVAYSLGGLVAQRAILKLNTENRDRISHLLLFGTPSNGITNNAIKKLWENKIKELIKGRPFIKKLRSDWDNAFPKKYPFDLKVVSELKTNMRVRNLVYILLIKSIGLQCLEIILRL